MYKYRFKQWRMFKYTKQGGTSRRHHNSQEDKATRPHASEDMVRRPKIAHLPPATVAKPLLLPGRLRELEICMNHMHRFLLATCGDPKKRRVRTVDPSLEMALDRLSWFFSVNRAVLQIHQGRLTAGFHLLDSALGQFRHSIASHDTGFPLRLVAGLSLFADHGLPGLAVIFLQYAYHALYLVLSPTHPFCIVVRYLQAMVSKKGLKWLMDGAWDLVAQ